VVIAASLIAAPALSLCAVGAMASASPVAALATRQRLRPLTTPIVASARRIAAARDGVSIQIISFLCEAVFIQ
jgi:hypothetical protein